MSMPSYPPNGADMTREQAITMIVASIAMEERALSHIIDAEGEKLQYILGKLEGDCSPHACANEVLEVNKSVAKMLDIVMQNQLLLKNKLATALEADCCPSEGCLPPECPRPPEPPCRPERPPCPPQKGVMQLTGRCSPFLWKCGCPIEWTCRCRKGGGIRWSEQSPSLVRLDPRRTYLVSYTVNICDVLPVEASGRICVESTAGAYSPPPLWFSIRCLHREPLTLQYSTMLLPCAWETAPLEIGLYLHARSSLCVEQAELNIAEL